MTISEAKKLYFKYDCSLFAMAREDKAYESYRNLNISKLIENEWKEELFTILAQQLRTSGEGQLLNRMCNLLEGQYDKDRLIILRQALNDVDFKDSETIAFVSESVLGRKELSVRSGAIFGSYDLGEHEMAKELLTFVWNLLSNHTVEPNLQARYKRDIKKCCIIDSILNLKIINKK